MEGDRNKSIIIALELLRASLIDDILQVTKFEDISDLDWQCAMDLLRKHGLAAVTFTSIEKLPHNLRPSKELILIWIGLKMQQERQYSLRRKAIDSLIYLWSDASLKVVELKGNSIGRYYPKPELRYSCDFDSFLLENDAIGVSGYERGNQIVESAGISVKRDFYKNSSFYWKGVFVENHQFCTPVRGNRAMKNLERTLRTILGTADFNALFLMEHMWSHFFEDALTLKQLADWMVMRKYCWRDVDEQLFECEARACGFWHFAESINMITDTLLAGGEMQFSDKATERLWQSILRGGGSVRMNNGWRTRFQLIGNYFSARWKYCEFSNHGALFTLIRTCVAFVFDRNPAI